MNQPDERRRIPRAVTGLLAGGCALVLSPLLLALGGCRAAEPAVTLGGERYTVEIADDEASRTVGLMFRDTLPKRHGMLFIFPEQAPRAFWMKNTKIPLDIIYFDRELRLVSVSANARPCLSTPCRNYPSAAPAMYVLELNAGEAARLGIKTGDRLVLHNSGTGKASPDSPTAEQ